MPKKGYKQTEEHKAKMIGRSNTFGKHWKLSQEVKDAISKRMKGKIHNYTKSKELREKLSKLGKSRVGELHPGWVKDRTKLKTDRDKSYDTKYKYWMMEVKKRDNWQCKILDSNCKGRLEAHHILGWKSHPELRYKINNGITLCQAHHPRKRSEEAKLSPFFQELVAERK